MAKLDKSTLPTSHSKEDFQCFGPPATKDGAFEGTNLCDCGCFNQGDEGDTEAVDSNKYYHAAVVQSKKDQNWYLYVEYGRVGVTNPQFQFTQCGSQAEAQSAYIAQCRSKNDKRGEWFQHPALGKILRPKKGKDCYLVRPQTTRSTGLPDARTITIDSPKKVVSIVGSAAKSFDFDKQSSKLLGDLNVGTISYTKSSMVNSALPTQEAIDEGRLICSHAQEVVNKAKKDADKELRELTKLLYSRIPKVKSLGETEWVLDANKINMWLMDLDAYEAALSAYNQTSTTTVQVTNLPFTLKWLDPTSKLGAWVSNFWKKATRNVHSYLNKDLKVLNIFEIDRKRTDFLSYLTGKGNISSKEVPLHQPAVREDIDGPIQKIYGNTKTWALFHGTRSCNVSGIMKEHFRLPKTLSGVAISGANFGSGTYFADDIKKSIGYCSYDGSYWAGGAGGIKSRGSFMFVCDAMIGNPHLASSSKAYQGPPAGYDSIFAKIGQSSVANNEFVVFDPRMSNLRYLVEFV